MACFTDDAHERWQRRSFSYSSSGATSSDSLSNYELEDDEIFFELVEHMLLSSPLKPTSLDSNRAAVKKFDDAEPNSTPELLTQRDAQRDDGQMQPDSGFALPPAFDRAESLQPRLKLSAPSVKLIAASARIERATIQPIKISRQSGRLLAITRIKSRDNRG